MHSDQVLLVNFPMKLPKVEIEKSFFHGAVVLKRLAITISLARQKNNATNEILFSDRLSQESEREIKKISFDSRSFNLQAFIEKSVPQHLCNACWT